jgi:rare lipoprotein A
MRPVLVCAVTAVAGCACSTSDTPAIPAVQVVEREGRDPIIPVLEAREGRASYVAQALDGRRTASGVSFDADAMVAAHPSYPFKTVVRDTELGSGRSVEVEIVDRGPASVARRDGVIIDLSRAAAEALGFVRRGRARVRVEVLRWGSTDARH